MPYEYVFFSIMLKSHISTLMLNKFIIYGNLTLFSALILMLSAVRTNLLDSDPIVLFILSGMYRMECLRWLKAAL